MHEYSIIQALVDRVGAEARKHNAAKVHGLQVRIGTLSGVEPELLKTAFDTFRQGTVCESAEITITICEARFDCPKCKRSFKQGEILRCPDCDLPAKLAAGDEILLEKIDMEVP